jgi:hypothetical protein
VCTPVSFFKVRELRPPGTVNKKNAARFMISRRRMVTVREASRRRLGKEAGRESFGEGGSFFWAGGSGGPARLDGGVEDEEKETREEEESFRKEKGVRK